MTTDNLAYTPGLGASVATDYVGGVHVQRVKIQHGADGVTIAWPVGGIARQQLLDQVRQQGRRAAVSVLR